jgi:hypothetical protein
MNMRTELLEALVHQCVREVLDQIGEEANASKLKSSGIGKDDNKPPVKQKVTVNPFRKGKGFKKNIKKLNEEEEPQDPSKGPEAAAPSSPEPAKSEEPKPEEPKPEEPKPEEPAQRIPKGASVLNPKDKSKLQPIRWQGRDESSIERTLHQVAVSIAGSRTKVSLGAKRLAREVVANPSATAFFYFGKTDPESEEVFLMADRSLQIAKDDSVQPGDLTGTPVVHPAANYTSHTWDEPPHEVNPDNKYAGWISRGKRAITATPRYGVDEPELNESAAKLIKQVVNKILDS